MSTITKATTVGSYTYTVPQNATVRAQGNESIISLSVLPTGAEFIRANIKSATIASLGGLIFDMFVWNGVKQIAAFNITSSDITLPSGTQIDVLYLT